MTRRLLGALAALTLLALPPAVDAQDAGPPTAASSAIGAASDTIGDLIGSTVANNLADQANIALKATLYHAGARGLRALDSLGCRLVAMRTAAVDGVRVPRHTILFIKETVGMPMPGGGVHDGYWYASDVGGAIHAGRIDLFTGQGAGSMAPMMALNLATLTVAKAGVFKGCPPG